LRESLVIATGEKAAKMVWRTINQAKQTHHRVTKK